MCNDIRGGEKQEEGREGKGRHNSPGLTDDRASRDPISSLFFPSYTFWPLQHCPCPSGARRIINYDAFEARPKCYKRRLRRKGITVCFRTNGVDEKKAK